MSKSIRKSKEEIITKDEFFLTPNVARKITNHVFGLVLIISAVLGLLGTAGGYFLIEKMKTNAKDEIKAELRDSEELKALTLGLVQSSLEKAKEIAKMEMELQDVSKTLQNTVASTKEKATELKTLTDQIRSEQLNLDEAAKNLSSLQSNINTITSVDDASTIEFVADLLDNKDIRQTLQTVVELKAKVKFLATQPSTHFFNASLATGEEWVAAAVAKNDFTGFCRAMGKEYVRHTDLLAGTSNHYKNSQRNGYFYEGWYYSGPRYCANDTQYWSNNSEKIGDPNYAYSVWQYNGGCGCCISDITHSAWGMERPAIVYCKLNENEITQTLIVK